MKKIILGTIMTTFSPFIVILGYLIISQFNVDSGALVFACVMGACSIIFNFLIGCALIIRGYQDQQTFKGWG